MRKTTVAAIQMGCGSDVKENIEKAFLDAKLRSFDIYWRKFAKGNTNAGRELS